MNNDEAAWMQSANCRGLGDEMFPEPGANITPTAKRVCDNCPVKAECLQYALDHSEPYGMWGGLTERQRRKLQRGRLLLVPERV